LSQLKLKKQEFTIYNDFYSENYKFSLKYFTDFLRSYLSFYEVFCTGLKNKIKTSMLEVKNINTYEK